MTDLDHLRSYNRWVTIGGHARWPVGAGLRYSWHCPLAEPSSTGVTRHWSSSARPCSG